jgi:hypothetical protein
MDFFDIVTNQNQQSTPPGDFADMVAEGSAKAKSTDFFSMVKQASAVDFYEMVSPENERINTAIPPDQVQIGVDSGGERPSLIGRLGKQAYNAAANIPEQLNIANATLRGAAISEEMIENPSISTFLGMFRKAYFPTDEEKKKQKTPRDDLLPGGETLSPVSLKAEVPPAENLKEKAVDIVANLGVLVGELLAANGLIPKGTPLSNEMAFELVNLANGGKPGAGAAQALALRGVSAGVKAAKGKLFSNVAKPKLPEFKPKFGEYASDTPIVTKPPSPVAQPAGNYAPAMYNTEGMPLTPKDKVIYALRNAAKISRPQQEKLYSAERAKRFAAAKDMGQKVQGESGLYAELGKLKGPLPKAQFESIRGQLMQQDIDSLFREIAEGGASKGLSYAETIRARTGLAKIFGEYGGGVPKPSEIDLLKKVFGADFTDEIIKHQPMLSKMKDFMYETLNVPRAVMASFDLSAPFRQGAVMVGKPKQFWPNFAQMFKYIFSDKNFQAAQEEIRNRPTFPLMEEAGLAVTNISGALEGMEERFMSNYAAKIPLIGRGIKASERAYVGFLNKLRADVFDDMLKKATAMGRHPAKDPALVKGIAGFVNRATGRGELKSWFGNLEEASTFLNSFFFSPRLMASRMSLLNPVYYVKADPFVRKEVLKTVFAAGAQGITVVSMMKLAGMDVETDPTGSDFMKLKVPGTNTRVDIWAGHQQYVVLAARMYYNSMKSTAGDKQIVLGEGYKPLTRADLLQRSFEYKMAPVASLMLTLLRKQGPFGEKLNIPKEAGLRFVPMVMQDAYDLYNEDPALVPIAGAALFGVGVQTYRHPNKQRPLSGLGPSLGGSLGGKL